MNAATPATVKLVADLLADSDNEIAPVFIEVLGRMPGKDEAIAVEARLVTDHSLFRCRSCRRWLSTGRIDPQATSEICYGCSATPNC